MTDEQLHELADRFLAAWTSQEVDRVLEIYSPELVYVDPNTRGAVEGRDGMRRYLNKLFAAWTMTWTLREAYPDGSGDNVAVLWHATFQRAEGGPLVEADGMDLVVVRDGLILRNEVYFDRTVLSGVAA